MSEVIGDETLFSLWPEQALCKPNGLDWSLNQQMIPVVLLDDGRVAFRSDNGQIHLLDGLQGVGMGEDVLLPLPELEQPAAELPTLSDATIKSMLVHGNLDAELPLEGHAGHELAVGKHLSNKLMLELGGKDMQLSDKSISDLTEEPVPQPPLDIDIKSLALYSCHYCSFTTTDVPILMLHFKTDHEHALELEEKQTSQDNSSVEEIVSSSSNEDSIEEAQEPARNVVVYLCSECNESFNKVEDCRDHMIKKHKMVFIDESQEGFVDDRMEDEEATPVSSVEPDPPSSSSPIPLEGAPSLTKTHSIMKGSPLSQASSLKQAPSNKQAPSLKKVPSPLPNPQPQPIKVLKKPRESKPKDYDPEFEAKPHKCTEPYCARKFKTISCLEKHIECHLSDDTRKFCCPHCSMLFNKWGQCALHLWKEHKIDVDLLVCKICSEYKTTTSKKLMSHIKIHSNERPYKCTVCGKGFKQRTQMVNHLASVHNKDKDRGDIPKWYMSQKCEICFKTYADSKCLKKHMQAVHNKLKPYKCQICDHMSAHKAMLQAHMRQHTGEKPFSCQVCPFKTGDHNSLRRHTMRHTDKRPYKCPHCEYSCIQSSAMKIHLINRHPGLGGTYICKQCCFETVNEKMFNSHMSDHKLNLIPPSRMEVFPENVAAAHLVYRSLGASASHIYCDVTASSTSKDGMKQTITISIPPEDNVPSDDEDTTQYLVGDVLDTGGITIPADPEFLPKKTNQRPYFTTGGDF